MKSRPRTLSGETWNYLKLKEYWAPIKNVPLERLTITQREIVQRIAESQTNAQIAAAMHVPLKTVEDRLPRLMRKLGLTVSMERCTANRALLTRWAIHTGLIASERLPDKRIIRHGLTQL